MIGLEPSQAALDLTHNAEPRQTGIVWPISHSAPHLRSQHHIVSHSLEHLTDDGLRSISAIEVRAIQKVTPELQSAMDNLFIDGIIFLSTKRRPKTDLRNLDAGLTELFVFHRPPFKINRESKAADRQLVGN
jgi:hypothetical protein